MEIVIKVIMIILGMVQLKIFVSGSIQLKRHK